MLGATAAMNYGRCCSTFVTGDLAPAVTPRRSLLLFGSCPPPPRRMAAAPLCVSTASKTTASEAADTAGKRPPRGITKPRPISPALQALVGVKEIPRTQALKQIWAYIKENDLQDPENRRIIVCDEKLKNIFGGKDRVGFLEISGLLNPHFEK